MPKVSGPEKQKEEQSDILYGSDSEQRLCLKWLQSRKPSQTETGRGGSGSPEGYREGQGDLILHGAPVLSQSVFVQDSSPPVSMSTHLPLNHIRSFKVLPL